MHVGFFGLHAVMPGTDSIPNLIQQFRVFDRSRSLAVLKHARSIILNNYVSHRLNRCVSSENGVWEFIGFTDLL